mgnify:FL=1
MLKTVGNPSTRYGNQTVVDGNLVIGTAGKGIDFTSDSHAAGMTSELFDDYEEGTWSPVVTASTGAISAYSASGTYTKVGRQVTVFYNVLISANGTGAGSVKVAGLPYTIANNRPYGVGNETDSVGFNVISQGIVTTDYALVLKFDGTYPGGSGYRLQGSFTYTV